MTTEERIAQIRERFNAAMAREWTPGLRYINPQDVPWLLGLLTEVERLRAEAVKHARDRDRYVATKVTQINGMATELAEARSTLDATMEQFEQYVADHDATSATAEILASRDRLGNALRDAESERDQLAAGVARVRELHRQTADGLNCVYCACLDRENNYDCTWPCETARALDGQETM